MSGSLLGRGRAGRLAVYAGCGVVMFLLVFLYNTSTSEMARLKELHTQCAHQQEALAAQLQVIFEYKVRLEKSLAEEKSSNAAVKQELQQRASREKSLRDKDSVEAMQRFNSLQQTYKLLQTEHKDLQEECKKRQKQALDDTTKLEETLKELRGNLRQAREEKEKSLEHLKTKYLELEIEKSRLEEKYNDLLKSNGNTNSTIDHLKKEVIQLTRELADTKKTCRSPSIDSIVGSIPTSQKSTSQQEQQPQQDPSVEKWAAGASAKQAPLQQQQQQNSASTTSMRGIPVLMKSESSTKSPLVAFSTTADKAKLMTKVKLPDGVVPIPVMMDSNVEDKQPENVRKKSDGFSPMRNSIHAEIKEKRNMDVMNLDAPPAKHVAEQILNRQDNDIMFRVRPGIQEIGDEPNHMGQMPGLDDGMAQNGNDGDQDQYDNEFYKERQQKNNDLHLEGEEDPEDEDDPLDYINDTKQDKRD